MKTLPVLILIGVLVVLLLSKIPVGVTIRGNNWTLYIPVLWMLLVSIILSLVFSIFHH